MLGANPSLHVFRVGFQLYGQLKYSLHEGMEVLGSTAILMASQATRLDKDSSVMVQDEHAPLRSNLVRVLSSGTKTFTLGFYQFPFPFLFVSSLSSVLPPQYLLICIQL